MRYWAEGTSKRGRSLLVSLTKQCGNEEYDTNHDNQSPLKISIAGENYISKSIEIYVKYCIFQYMDSTAIVIALNALAHGHRLEIFRQLVQAGPEGFTAGTLSSRLKVSPSSLSFHLKDLVGADLIQQRHVGRQIFYSARFETMNAVISYLTENCCGGNPCSPVCAIDCSTEGRSS